MFGAWFVALLAFALETQAFQGSTGIGGSQPRAFALQTRVCSPALVRGTNDDADTPSDGLKIGVVGAGPSGLLLSHLLLRETSHSITLVDGRSDPRTNQLEGRAYALGIGIRGRTAIRSVDEALWEAVKSKGYESERFKLHIGLPFRNKDLVVPLRSDSEGPSAVEPSLLIYQSELCRALLEELQVRDYSNETNLRIQFDTKVVSCDFETMTIQTTTSTDSPSTTIGPFDLIIGCDGVNSCVRSSIDEIFPGFETTKERLPGFFKVVRLDRPVGQILPDGSEPYDTKAVSLLIPSGAFIEPTGNDGSCCILFSGREVGGDASTLPLYLRERQNTTAVIESLQQKFPLWREDSFEPIAKQLVTQDVSSNSAYSVTCNTYHYKDKAVLVGDAAHATGGVSGQGVNSALIDAQVLADCLYQKDRTLLEDATLEYSSLQLPQGKALYDLSFGPKPSGAKKKLLWGLKNAGDALFGGRFGIGELPLQTRLSSEMTSFADIRRERDYFYRDDEDANNDMPSPSFPSDEEFRERLRALHSDGKK